jgi:hypothetical protein
MGSQLVTRASQAVQERGMRISSFSSEQENFLLEFLEKAESWVQDFVWNVSDKSRRVLRHPLDRDALANRASTQGEAGIDSGRASQAAQCGTAGSGGIDGCKTSGGGYASDISGL